MRIADNMLTRGYLKNLSVNQQNVQKFHQQLSSMKEVSKPSDNPLLVSQIMELKENIIQNGQYQTTLTDAKDWTDMQDAALSNATDSLMRISTLVQSAANGTMNESDRLVVKAEVETEMQTFVDSLNTNFGGRYIFGGTKTTILPFEITKADDGSITGIQYKGKKQNISREISSGVNLDLMTDGSKLLNSDKMGDLFVKITDALQKDDVAALSNLLADTTASIDHVVTFRTEIGAISNRLDSALSRNESQDLNLQEMLSSKEDIDIAQKYMQFSMEQVAYQASLQMGTKVLSTTILDYL
ncbi:flagellar hook-associated protein 3 [Jeotgalibaca porci]|uniref:Flagellar hook-associated protein 3 n=1 Tax=Jeotgalibaca porci TaxID=1868793 RepID=A0A6G7WHB8_9LACT|nr:flagellar hook-associated protein FlgL [Jeotgalibaca porci]QIK51626.1 flagellar hook-associated protein 3 [Jeotgalibaca porci]